MTLWLRFLAVFVLAAALSSTAWAKEHKALHKTHGKPVLKAKASRYGSGENKAGHNRYHKH